MAGSDVMGETVAARPGAGLAPLVERYVGYRYAGFAPGTHLGLPSRHLTVVISLGAPTRTVAMPDPRQPPAALTALAGGLHTSPAVIAHDGDLFGVQLALTPPGARALLGLPAGEIAGLVLALDDLLGPDAREVVERMSAATTWRARFAALDDVLRRRAARVPGRSAAPCPELVHAWRCLTGSDGTARISEVADEVGWSRRHLGARFAAEYGLTPKEAARVLRFERSRKLVQQPGRPSLAAVAVACGYYDQAHLAREWNAIIGRPPSAWLAGEQLPFVQDDDGTAA